MVIIEPPIFTKRIQELITDEEYRLLQIHLVNRPDGGKIITGSGGLRKLRWSAGGHGKRGGIRVIYYWFTGHNTILFLYAYSKSEQDDLTIDQLRQLKKIIEKGVCMKKELFEELLESVKQGSDIMKGKIKPSRSVEFPESEVQKIREKYGLSQDKFASLMGISVGTLRNWEQGRRNPEGPARILLRVAAAHPEAILDVTKHQKIRKRA